MYNYKVKRSVFLKRFVVSYLLCALVTRMLLMLIYNFQCKSVCHLQFCAVLISMLS